jgi:hypothetical protein
MKKIFKSILLIMAVATTVGFLAGCKDDDDSSLNGLFRPVINESDNITHGLDDNNNAYMIIHWDNYTNANKYTVNIEANDGSDTRTESTDTTFMRFNNLQYDKEYNISITAENTTTNMQSKPFTLTTTSLDYPTNLATLSATDIIDIAARVRWSEGVFYDQLRVLQDSNDSLVVEAAVSADDNIAAEKVVYGLKPKTTYKVEAWSNGTYKGKKRFTTAASEKFSGDIIDLRGLDEDTAWKWFSTGSSSGYANTLDSLIKTQYQDKNLTIVLEGGTRYRIATIELPATTGIITFVTGLSLAGEAQLGVEGNFRVAGNSTVGGVVFNKVAFTDTENKPRTDGDHYGATYVFNLNQSEGNIGVIKFLNSSIKYKRGVCRIQTAARIDSVVFDNCVIDSISGYGLTNADNAKADIQNVLITNTTVSNAEKICVGTKGLQPNSLVVKNCTFVYTIADNKPFFDFNSKNWDGFKDTFEFRNCLLGHFGRNTQAAEDNPDEPKVGITGWSGTVQPNCYDIYFTSDVLWAPVSEEDPSPKAAFEGVTLSTNTVGTFKDPLRSNFQIITNELGGTKATPGDPRWY